MYLKEFIDKWTNKTIDFDGIYPNQCYDLAHQFIYECLEITDKKIISHPSAFEIFTKFNENGIDAKYFECITNTPTGVPVAGDVVVFGQEVGQYGHVCIFVSGTSSNFKSFDANWPVGSLPHIQDHTYKGVLGWLHPKDSSNETVAVTKVVFEELVTKATKLDAFNKLGFESVEGLIKTLDEHTKIVQDLNGENESLKLDLEKMRVALAQLTEVDYDPNTEIGQLRRALDSCKTVLQQSLSELPSGTTDLVGAVHELVIRCKELQETNQTLGEEVAGLKVKLSKKCPSFLEQLLSIFRKRGEK
jgi:regulator of replication initiation timing